MSARGASSPRRPRGLPRASHAAGRAMRTNTLSPEPMGRLSLSLSTSHPPLLTSAPPRSPLGPALVRHGRGQELHLPDHLGPRRREGEPQARPPADGPQVRGRVQVAQAQLQRRARLLRRDRHGRQQDQPHVQERRAQVAKEGAQGRVLAAPAQGVAEAALPQDRL
jgi:hypothetical protein